MDETAFSPSLLPEILEPSPPLSPNSCIEPRKLFLVPLLSASQRNCCCSPTLQNLRVFFFCCAVPFLVPLYKSSSCKVALQSRPIFLLHFSMDAFECISKDATHAYLRIRNPVCTLLQRPSYHSRASIPRLPVLYLFPSKDLCGLLLSVHSSDGLLAQKSHRRRRSQAPNSYQSVIG